jgi:cytochrome c oxidase cbb3-type subunit 4
MEWNMNLMREAVTLVSFAAFLGIVIWAWSGRRKSQFDAAARIPLDEDDQPVNLRGDRS